MSIEPQKSGPEQRRQMRFAVAQPARMVMDSGREIICDIADFCLGGLFLKFAIPEKDSDWVKGQEGQYVRVTFTTPAALGAQTHEMRAKLVRRTATGVGVAFDETPVEATRALNKVAAAMRSQKASIKLYGGVDIAELKNTCKAYLKQAIDDAFKRFGEQIGAKLEGASLSAKSIAEHQEFLDAPRLIQYTLGDAQYRCLNSVFGALESLGGTVVEEEPETGGLSIVEKDEFEDWLSLAAESNRLEEMYAEALMNIEPRLEKVYGVPITPKTNPFGPAVIGEGVKHAFADIALSAATRHVVYGVLRDALAVSLKTLYQSLLDVLPEVDKKPASAAAAGSGGADDLAQTLDDLAALESQAAGPDSIIPGMPSGSAGSVQAAPTSLGRMASSLMGMFRRNQAARMGGQTASPEKPGQTSAAGNFDPLGATRVRRDDSMSGGSLGFHPGLSESSVQAFQDLISTGRIPAARQEEARVSADVFGALIEAMNTERAVPTEVKSQVRKLEDSLLKIAVMDPTYLNNPRHAAHRTINAVDRLSMVSGDDGKINDEQILKHINRWVERIHNEADKNPNVFEEARQQLEKILLPLMKKRAIRIAKLQAALEGWQKTGQANRMVLQQLDQRIAGKQVPSVVLDLFAPGWRNYLIRVILRKGAGCEEETEAWRVIDNLLKWLSPEGSEKPAYQEIQQLLQLVDSRLRLVSADKDGQDRLVDRLTEALLKPGQVEYKTITTVLPAGAGKDGSSENENQVVNPLDSFRVGDWVSFPKATVPLNLIWMGDDPSLYVFCNYKGVKKLELKREEFAELVKSGEATHTDNLDLPLMDRSFSSMIQHMHRNLLKQATADEATGLLERREFMRQARRTLLNVSRDDEGEARTSHVMGVLDFEDMRLIEARTGPDAHLALLKALADYLRGKLAGGLVTRGAERTFAFMLPVIDRDQMQELAENIMNHVNQFQFRWSGTNYTLNANLGLACANIFSDPEELYNRADEACLESKHQGRNQIVTYRDEAAEQKEHIGLVYWASKLSEVLHDGRLFLRCQPIVSVANDSGMPSHYEILLGANLDTEEPVNIGEMVAAVERLRRVNEVDQWVVSSIFQWIRDNPEKLERISGFSINLSGQSVNSKGFLNFLTAQLGRGDIPGHKLIFEITESAAIDSFTHAEQFIRQVRRYGCKFALDDFGIGFSSFSYLKNLKVDYLKIDGSFVKDMSRSEVDVALVSSMHETSRFLGIKTVAEAVEDQETLDILKNIGVDYAQGYFTGRPMPIDQLAA
jgi:diguanylate cyclase (GGDEF)-like protein